jgi:hypothetical protein
VEGGCDTRLATCVASLVSNDVASKRRLAVARKPGRMSSCAASGTLRGGVSQQGSEVQYNPLARRAAGLTCSTEDDDDDDDDEPISRSVSPRVRLLLDMHTGLSWSPHSTARTQAAALRAYYSRKRYSNQVRARADVCLDCGTAPLSGRGRQWRNLSGLFAFCS